MVFLRCHPAVTRETLIALTMKTVRGFSVGEIARAFSDPSDSGATSPSASEGASASVLPAKRGNTLQPGRLAPSVHRWRVPPKLARASSVDFDVHVVIHSTPSAIPEPSRDEVRQRMAMAVWAGAPASVRMPSFRRSRFRPALLGGKTRPTSALRRGQFSFALKTRLPPT